MRKTINMTEFFKTMAEMVAPHMSHVRIKGHNLDGCRLLGSGRAYRAGDQIRRVRPGHFLFSFVAKGDFEVGIDLDMDALDADPKLYCDRILEKLNRALGEARKQRRIIIIPGLHLVKS